MPGKPGTPREIDGAMLVSELTGACILLLNTHEPDHIELATAVRGIVHDLRVVEESAVLEKKVDDAVDAIMNQRQMILKREWIRVKSGT